MSEYAPPAGPPPPKVSLYKVGFDNRYLRDGRHNGTASTASGKYPDWSEVEKRFYVNLHTKQSQWERPTEPARPIEHGPPSGPPPSYAGGASPRPEKGEGLSSNNPYSGGPANVSNQNISEDERFARQLQAEEEARMQQAGGPRPLGNRGESDSYYQQAQQAAAYQGPSYDQQLPPREPRKGGLGGLLGKLSGKTSGQPQYGQYPPQQYQQPQYVQGPPQGYGGGYPQAPPRRHGLGAGGGAALGLGGGLLGGALLADAFDHHGGDDGGGDDGGDYGGDGGGDYGGDGGGDFGGGD